MNRNKTGKQMELLTSPLSGVFCGQLKRFLDETRVTGQFELLGIPSGAWVCFFLQTAIVQG